MSEIIRTDAAPPPVGRYPHARRVGQLLFLSGIGPRTPGSNAIPGNVYNAAGRLIDYDIVTQCHSVFANVRAVLEASHCRWDWLVDVTVYLTDMARDFATYNRIWAENRENWLKELRNALYGRHNADFPGRLTTLLQNPESFWTANYRKAYPAVEASLARLLSDLFNSADERQRNALRQHIGELVADLRGLDCYPR